MADNIWSEHVKEAGCKARQIAGATTLSMADHGSILWCTAAASITNNTALQDGFHCFLAPVGATITVGDGSVLTATVSMLVRQNSTTRLVVVGASSLPVFA